MSEPFRVICADPAWAFGDKLPGPGRGAEKHYKVMDTFDIECFSLPPLADDCLLFLWRVAAMQQEALDVVRAWGFTLKTEIVWVKKTKNGKRHFGMGRIVRAEHETCLVATRGKVEIASHSIRSTFETDVEDESVSSVFEAQTGIHSEKPEHFYREIVEKLSPGPYVEIFARREREGWTCLGDEL